MEGIRSDVGVQAQQPKKSNKALKHTANAGMTAVGLGAVKYVFDKTQDIWACAQVSMPPEKTVRTSRFSFNWLDTKIKFSKKIKNAFENLGEKLTKNPKIHRMFVQYEKGYGATGADLAKSVRFNKGTFALCLTLGLAALSVLAAGLYKAGKINGEG